MGDIGWEEALCPARHPVGLGQEPPREQLVVRRHLPVHDVFGQDMFAKTGKKTSSPAPRQLSPGAGNRQELMIGMKAGEEPTARWARAVRDTHPRRPEPAGPPGTAPG